MVARHGAGVAKVRLREAVGRVEGDWVSAFYVSRLNEQSGLSSLDGPYSSEGAARAALAALESKWGLNRKGGDKIFLEIDSPDDVMTLQCEHALQHQRLLEAGVEAEVEAVHLRRALHKLAASRAVV